MDQRVTLITLGVADVARARAFYEALGWQAGPGSQESVAFFQVGGLVLGLWGREELARDSGYQAPPPPGAVALAYNVGSADDVDAVLTDAERVGAHIVRKGAPTEWGGYSGLFRDLDGHPWEVAHNPFWRLAEDGSVQLGA